ncbi:MAG: hypothetical protein JWO07_10 [Candidatus Saccharibacteria bacterium]|nr:hypothetical protein [Candidatus Saccharibacteria bacterium]
MPEWQAETFKRGAARVTSKLRGATTRRKVVLNFAKKHHLIYFQTVHPDSEDTPAMRGSSASTDQVDSNYCIGSHADYDMALIERTSSIAFEGYKTTIHRWYVLQIDLKNVHNLPFIFLGTKQQTKAYYARILTAHREARYLSLTVAADKSAQFHAAYALLSSPAELPLLYRLFTDETIDSIAGYNYPFAIEIDGDSVMFITEATKPSEQLLDELLHYGLWIAKAIDSRLT